MTSQALRAYLVRHGEVDANTEMRYLGSRDDVLNVRGQAQAMALAGVFRDLPVDRVLSSPMARTIATAQAIASAAGLPTEEEERLAEMGFGQWEGLTRDEVLARGPEDAALLERWERDAETSPPDGESLDQVQRRCLELMDDLKASSPGHAVVLVSHMGPIKALLCAALDLPLTATRRIFLDPATISVVDWGSRPIVRLINAHEHLGWSNARWLETS
jgi:broad specificity phosphatase PhoE